MQNTKLPTQRQFVKECMALYASMSKDEQALYKWENAHFPVPECEGGKEVVRLRQMDHARQGVLQSEEYNRPCIHGYERQFLLDDPQYLELHKKWMRIKAIKAAHAQSPEGKKKGGMSTFAKGVGIYAPGVASEGGKKSAAKLNQRQFVCTVSGYISTAGGLTSYQKKRGIDPSNRRELT